MPAVTVAEDLFLSCSILAVADYIQETARLKAERQALSMKSQFAAEHAKALYQTLLETRMARHEIRNRAETLQILCQQGDFERVKKYAAQLQAASQFSPSLYTKNLLVNGIIAPRLQTAIDAGIQAKTLVQIPESLPIDDLDLSTYLANLLDNAVVAAAAVADGTPRQLELRMTVERGRLCIFCSNSCQEPAPDSAEPYRRPEGEWHGYGLQHMRAVAKKYGSQLEILFRDGRCAITARLRLRGDVPENFGEKSGLFTENKG